MAVRLKISGNFFLILNSAGTIEDSRHLSRDVTYQVYDELLPDPKFVFSGLLAKFNSKSSEENSFLFSELIDDTTGVAFTSIANLKIFLDANAGKSNAPGSGAVSFGNLREVSVTGDSISDDFEVHFTQAGLITFTLRTVDITPFRHFKFVDKIRNSAVNTITIATEGAQTINGLAAFVINANGGFVSMRVDSSNNLIING